MFKNLDKVDWDKIAERETKNQKIAAINDAWKHQNLQKPIVTGKQIGRAHV